jgi:hypothetical protein
MPEGSMRTVGGSVTAFFTAWKVAMLNNGTSVVGSGEQQCLTELFPDSFRLRGSGLGA